MEIEVKQSDGAFVKAFVKSIVPDGIEVSYEGGWKPDQKVDYENCRISKVANKSTITNSGLKIGDEIEACLMLSSVHQWKKAKILDIKGTFAKVETDPGQVDIIPCEMLRPLNSSTPLTFDKLQQFPIKVNDVELIEHFKKEGSFKDFIEMVGNIHMELVQESDNEANLVVWSYLDQALKRAKVVKDFFIKDTKRKLLLLQRQEEANKFEEGGDGAVAPPKFFEEFSVPEELCGLVIGKKGANLLKARKIPGIKLIDLDEKRCPTHVFVKIHADTHEAIDEARNMLEYVYGKVKIKRAIVGKIIGKSGDRIQEIVDKSGVMHVKVVDPEENGELTDEVEFLFTGTKETVSLAELLINYQLKHNEELDEIRAHLPSKPDPVRRRRMSSYGRGQGGGDRGGGNRRQMSASQSNYMPRGGVGGYRGRGNGNRGRGRLPLGRGNYQEQKKRDDSPNSITSENDAKQNEGVARRRRLSQAID